MADHIALRFLYFFRFAIDTMGLASRLAALDSCNCWCYPLRYYGNLVLDLLFKLSFRYVFILILGSQNFTEKASKNAFLFYILFNFGRPISIVL